MQHLGQDSSIHPGDFTRLAKFYNQRMGYSYHVLGILGKHVGLTAASIIADVGAGTGKLTSCLLGLPCQKIFAVEPNDAMRAEGKKHIRDPLVEWRAGSGENTGLQEHSVDWILVGSAFHWMDTKKALRQFARVLKPGGYVTVLWNPRDIERSPLHTEIEKIVQQLAPEFQRRSSGRGRFTQDMPKKLASTGAFGKVRYVEDAYEETMTRERYMDIWKSVNDIQSHLGPEKFNAFLTAITKIIAPYTSLVIPYKTVSWTARRVVK